MRGRGRSVAFLAALAAAGWWVQSDRPAPARDARQPPPVRQAGQAGPDDGRRLFVTGCSSCHGIDGAGSRQGPSLQASGAAGAYYYLSTGRMPLADNESQPRRNKVVYSSAEIDLLVDYVASLGDGPAIPEVDPAAADLARGGVLYRTNCAPCHTASGIGGALSYGRAAPSLASAEPLQVASAMRIGPGQMPPFGPPALSDDEIGSIVAYVGYLRAPPTPGGAALGGAGPIPEGFVAWIFGVGTLLVAILWIGKRQERHGQA